MKFSCYKDDITKALKFVLRAAATKPATPILAGVYLRAENNILTLQANNYQLGIIAKIPVNTETNGATVVSGKRLNDFLSKIDGDVITFNDSGDILTINSGSAVVELLTMKPDDFPQVKESDIGRSCQVRAAWLKDLIRRTVFAVSKDESRPIFTGGLIQIGNGKISFTATNTHRLAHATLPSDDVTDYAEFTIPAESLTALMNQLDPKEIDTEVDIRWDDKTFAAKFNNFVMVSRQIEGMFPPFDRIPPKSTATNVEVEVAPLKRALEVVALIAKEDFYNTIKLGIADGGIKISATSSEVGNVENFVQAKVTGDELNIAFNVNYILDMLKVVNSTTIHIGFNDMYSPAKFTEDGDSNYIYVVTPVRSA
ncbi:MAG: DNA polymerase III subunit beta [Selenomonadaceae bacterium]|nr:DNA polymerase III subunit beta [Selenomonadaceae bacterium]